MKTINFQSKGMMNLNPATMNIMTRTVSIINYLFYDSKKIIFKK